MKKLTSFFTFTYALFIAFSAQAHLHPFDAKPQGAEPSLRDLLLEAKHRFEQRQFTGQDHFVRIIMIGDEPVAEFEFAFPVMRYGFNDNLHYESYFRLNLNSLLTRMKNIAKRKNYTPSMISEEKKALEAMIKVIIKKGL